MTLASLDQHLPHSPTRCPTNPVDSLPEASQKAKAISEALDVKIIEVIEVNEGSVSVRRVPPQRFAASLAEVNAAATPVSPGQLTVSASVTIRYRIGQ